jgi:O-antigen ligase
MDPNVLKWCVVYGLGAGGFLVWRWERHHAWALLLAGYAGLSLIWSPDRHEAAYQLINVVALLGCYLLSRRWLLPVHVLALGAIGLSFVDLHGGFGNVNWQTEFLLLCLPFIVGLSLYRIGLVLAVLGLLLWLGSDVKWAVAGLGAGWLIWHLVFRVRQYGFALVVFLVPLNAMLWRWEAIVNSLKERAELWFNTLRLWWEAPLFGNGLGSFDYLYPRFQEFHTRFFEGTLLREVTMSAGQAHNEFLQILAALGLVGLAGFILVGYGLFRNLTGTGKWVLAIGCVVGFFGFPLQIPGTALLLVAGASLRRDCLPGAWSLSWPNMSSRVLAGLVNTRCRLFRATLKPHG